MVKPETVAHLDAINRAFYGAHGEAFSGKRDRPWAGWTRVLEGLPGRSPLRVLDLGCGNGRFAGFLANQGVEVEYLGLDASESLLAVARARHSAAGTRFERFDVVGNVAGLPGADYDLIVAMGLLHHVPGRETRRGLLAAATRRLAPSGQLVVTWWRYATLPRFAERILPWADHAGPGLDRDDLEEGDHLLAWGGDPGALRYCNFASEAELEELRERLCQGPPRLHFEAFRDDGPGGDLNRYWRLERPRD